MPVEDLSFERMGKDLDTWVGEVRHETDFRNLLSGNTYAEKDIQTLIHGKSVAADKPSRKTAKHSKIQSSIPSHKVSEGQENTMVSHSSPARVIDHETPLTKHWVKAPAAEKVMSAQQQLRALGGPEIVYHVGKMLHRHSSLPLSQAAIRARRARAMRSDADASRVLGNYFARAHSTVTSRPAVTVRCPSPFRVGRACLLRYCRVASQISLEATHCLVFLTCRTRSCGSLCLSAFRQLTSLDSRYVCRRRCHRHLLYCPRIFTDASRAHALLHCPRFLCLVALLAEFAELRAQAPRKRT